MDQILFAAALLPAYLAAYFFIKYDNKRIEAECKFPIGSDRAEEA